MKYKNGKVISNFLGRTSSRYVIGKNRIIEFNIPLFEGKAKDRASQRMPAARLLALRRCA